MQITLICCPFKTSFGSYGASLKAAIEKKTGTPAQWVASNCGCGTAMTENRVFLTDQCDYFEMLVPGDFVSKKAWKRQLRAAARTALLYFRAKRYSTLAKNANVVHFQQILNAYGAKAVFHWLNQPSNAPTQPELAATLNQRKDQNDLSPFKHDVSAQIKIPAEGVPPRLSPSKALEDLCVWIRLPQAFPCRCKFLQSGKIGDDLAFVLSNPVRATVTRPVMLIK